ncbi:acyl-homoserine-lactone synthase [Paraburkholderia phenazinium]|jgi:N-acyl-L-homoserine lactone synthetase|uniref:Acyl-homoserine-lactone synthase n=1 Tax=Paraburkholderia phenazinium TaxID=60549 RepID=A0A1G7YYH0_9BURK|nr:acyl-homoserine-lactone synthase [Paraburkholderia phenazinium]SDH01444.1 acyl homoserine lactone synthase [Paraburkholderia phenazinium]
MPTVISGSRLTLPLHLIDALGRYRHEVFVKRLGWQLPMVAPHDDTEWDEFDGPNTLYVMLLDDTQTIRGCARLLPTTAPYLLPKLLPDPGDARCVVDPRVWELSRVAVSDEREAASADNDAGDWMTMLLRAVIAEAADRQVDRLIGLAVPGMMRLYSRKGIRLVAEGPGLTLEGEALRVFSLDVNQCSTLHAPSAHAGLTERLAAYRTGADAHRPDLR